MSEVKLLDKVKDIAGDRLSFELAMVVLSGLSDENYQRCDMEKVMQNYLRAQKINKEINQNSTKQKAEPKFISMEQAKQKALEILKMQKADSEKIKKAESFSVKSNYDFKKLHDDVSSSCSGNDSKKILGNLGISDEKLKSFMDSYLTLVVTQLVGGAYANGAGVDTEKVSTTQGIETIKSDNKAAMVIGLPGAGKSTTINDIKNNINAFHVDADAIKGEISKCFNVSINAEGIHEISSFVRDNLVSELQRYGVNIILEKIGASSKSIVKARKNLGEKYDVDLALVHVKNSRSQTNNAMRCQGMCEKYENGDTSVNPRMVEPNSIEKYGNAPLETYLQLRYGVDADGKECKELKGLFKNTYAYSNESIYVGKHSTADPIVIAGISDGKNKKEQSYIDKTVVAFKKIKKQIMEFAFEQESLKLESIKYYSTLLKNKGKSNTNGQNVIAERYEKVRSTIKDLLFAVYNPESRVKDTSFQQNPAFSGIEIKNINIRDEMESMTESASKESIAQKLKELYDQMHPTSANARAPLSVGELSQAAC